MMMLLYDEMIFPNILTWRFKLLSIVAALGNVLTIQSGTDDRQAQ